MTNPRLVLDAIDATSLGMEYINNLNALFNALSHLTDKDHIKSIAITGAHLCDDWIQDLSVMRDEFEQQLRVQSLVQN